MKKYFLLFAGYVLLWGCTEELDSVPNVSATIDSDKILVIEANLTGELKTQQIRLSNVTNLQNDSLVITERNALVNVTDDLGTVFDFVETDFGSYTSAIPFAIEADRTYQLAIETTNGDRFVSSPESLPEISTIANIYAEKTSSQSGSEGVSIVVDAAQANQPNVSYRYEYEETYQIIAPFWTPRKFELSNYDPCFLPIQYDLELVPRTAEEQRVCYNTERSTTILQVDATPNAETRGTSVRFIGKSNFIISHRYSILVKQLSDTPGAKDFYRQLNAFNSAGLVFSQIQPGGLPTNISSGNSSTEVIGYFALSAVDEQRIFFDFEDFFPDDPKPEFVNKCPITSAPLEPFATCLPGMIADSCPQSILERVDLNLIAYYDQNPDEGLNRCEGPYLIVDRVCGDCTALGSDIRPAFWVD